MRIEWIAAETKLYAPDAKWRASITSTQGRPGGNSVRLVGAFHIHHGANALRGQCEAVPSFCDEIGIDDVCRSAVRCRWPGRNDGRRSVRQYDRRWAEDGQREQCRRDTTTCRAQCDGGGCTSLDWRDKRGVGTGNGREEKEFFWFWPAGGECSSGMVDAIVKWFFMARGERHGR